jgi:Zn ribbon nucleic-acid-binding protein
MNQAETRGADKMTTTKQSYQLAGRRCPRCESTGPLLLDPSDNFTIVDEEIRFPPGAWGLDIDCECPACGFAGELGNFVEWSEVTGEERKEMLENLRRLLDRYGPI